MGAEQRKRPISLLESTLLEPHVKQELGLNKQHATQEPEKSPSRKQRKLPSEVGTQSEAPRNEEATSSNSQSQGFEEALLTHLSAVEGRTSVENGRDFSSEIVGGTSEVSESPAQTTFNESVENSLTCALAGLPLAVMEKYFERGVHDLFLWQKQCLLQARALRLKTAGSIRNLLVALPTSAGKSLIAEVEMIRCTLATGHMSLLVVPFVSLVQEKAAELNALVEKVRDAAAEVKLKGMPLPLVGGKRDPWVSREEHASQIRVEEYFGTSGTFPIPDGPLICVATIEKAYAIVNALVESRQRSRLGLVAVDELHMVGEGRRGGLLESLISSILFCFEQTRIIGMSATIPNLQEIGSWMQAEVFEANFRPVDLLQSICSGSVLYSPNRHVIGQLPHEAKNMDDRIFYLVVEGLKAGSVLVFCPTRQSTERTASRLAKQLDFLGNTPDDSDQGDRERAIQELEANIGSIDRSFAACIRVGVGFHHGGLAVEERETIEACFRQGCLKVICCTSTLAAGVNLPARRVIIRSFRMGTSVLTSNQYRQMIGRAGRKGLDSMGESFLLVDDNERDSAFEIAAGSLAPVKSQLQSYETLTKMVLDIVVRTMQIADESREETIDLSKQCVQLCDLVNTFKNSLLFLQRGPSYVRELVSFGVICLCLHELLIPLSASFKESLDAWAKGSESLNLPSPQPQERFGISPLGLAAAFVPFSLGESLVLYYELQRARESLCLSDDLHMCFLLSPMPIKEEAAVPSGGQQAHDSGLEAVFGLTESGTKTKTLLSLAGLPLPSTASFVSWDVFLSKYLRLNDRQREICHRVGISESFLIKKSHGTPSRVKINGNLEGASVKAKFHYVLTKRSGNLDSDLLSTLAEVDSTIAQVLRDCSAARLYSALILRELMNEVEVVHIAKEYKIDKGFLQQLGTRASAYASHRGQVAMFCQKCGWLDMEALCKLYASRINGGVRVELIPLTEIPFVKRARARALWVAGYRSVLDVAKEDPERLGHRVKFAPSNGLSVGIARKVVAHARQVLRNRTSELSAAMAALDRVNKR